MGAFTLGSNNKINSAYSSPRFYMYEFAFREEGLRFPFSRLQKDIFCWLQLAHLSFTLMLLRSWGRLKSSTSYWRSTPLFPCFSASFICNGFVMKGNLSRCPSSSQRSYSPSTKNMLNISRSASSQWSPSLKKPRIICLKSSTTWRMRSRGGGHLLGSPWNGNMTISNGE